MKNHPKKVTIYLLTTKNIHTICKLTLVSERLPNTGMTPGGAAVMGVALTSDAGLDDIGPVGMDGTGGGVAGIGPAVLLGGAAACAGGGGGGGGGGGASALGGSAGFSAAGFGGRASPVKKGGNQQVSVSILSSKIIEYSKPC